MERIPCQNQEICPLFDTEQGCFEDVHHLYYPKAKYRGVAKTFRQLDSSKVEICRNLHNNEHALVQMVPLPSMDVMHEAIRREKEARRS